MDSFGIDNVEVEKANAIMRYNRPRKIAKLFRFVKMCLALILFSWFSTRLPIAVRIFSDYFRDFCVALIRPCFVFLIGNVIILTLLTKSGMFSGHKNTANNAGTDFYDEILKRSENHQKIRKDSSPPAPEEIVYQDKQTVYEESSVTRLTHTCRDRVTDMVHMDTPTATETKVYRRSPSEKLERKVYEKPRRELRQAETQKYRKVGKSTDEREETSYSEEDNGEEFRRMVEAFIAKLHGFHREEAMAIVLQKQS